MILKSCTIALFLAITLTGYGQKLILVPDAGLQLGPKSYYVKNFPKPADVSLPGPGLEVAVGITIRYHHRGWRHSLLMRQSIVGVGFAIFSDRPGQLVGDLYSKLRYSTNQILLAYKVGQQFGRTFPVFKKRTVQPFADAGLGVGFNRSRNYYREVFNVEESYFTFQQTGTYMYTRDSTTRLGAGIFAIGQFGFSYRNKKAKDVFELTFYYNMGLKDMNQDDLTYYHGNTIDNWRVDGKARLRTRGTSYGVKLGFPIRILKE